MSTQYSLVVIIITLCNYTCYSKYAENSEDETGHEGTGGFPSLDSYEDALADEDDRELPTGYVVLDGVVLDATNLMVQELATNSTKYRMYKKEAAKFNAVVYERPRREAGWHFILFEDPQETSGTGHLILLQKLLGFTMSSKVKTSFGSKELRLYEVFHVDLSNKITEEFEEENDNENYDQDGDALPDPNDSATIVSANNLDQYGKIADNGNIIKG